MITLTVSCLGPLEVAVDGRPVRLTAGRLRTLVVLLALAGGQVVTVERLAGALWGEHPPVDVRRSLQVYLARLRQVLGPDSIVTVRPGYRLRIEPDDVDALRFVRLLEQGATEPALALWRGTPFQDVESVWVAESESPRLVERYLAATEQWIDQQIGAGRAADLVPKLTELADRHPLRESLWARLLTVLQRTGRQAEALDRYGVIRERISAQLGVDPGSELQRIHARLQAPLHPRQLPTDIAGFTGRQRELQLMDRYADESRVLLLTGSGGTGKTTLAVHWAHRRAERFPNGQLYLNLRGFDRAGPPVTVPEAVRGFLDAFGLPVTRLPTGVDDQLRLYRELLAGTRTLVLLDNARDAEQVRALVPGTAGCLVVVTSRGPLTGLDAPAVELRLFSTAEATEFLTHRLGFGEVAAAPDAVAGIVDGCAGLPLALAIVAARAASQPGFGLPGVAAELRETRLDVLAGIDDPATDIRAAFSWSYRTLTAGTARLFRFWGLHPGTELGPEAAASLAGVPVKVAEQALRKLRQAGLATEQPSGRYGSHDLLRAYAAELVQDQDDRTGAIRRLLDHYLQSAHQADLVLHPERERVELIAPDPAATTVDLEDRAQATAWLAVEQHALLAAVELAAESGFDAHCWQLARTLADFLYRRALWRELVSCHQSGLAAAGRLGDPAAQARAHRGVSRGAAKLGDHDLSRQHAEAALAIYQRSGDRIGQAHTQLALGHLLETAGRPGDALDHARLALQAFRDAGDQAREANALNAVGWLHGQLGDHDRALRHCRQAVDLHGEIGESTGHAAAWNSLGFLYLQLGDHPQSIACCQRAIDMSDRLGDRVRQAGSYRRLAEAHQAAGDPAGARQARQRAAAILDELRHPDAR